MSDSQTSVELHHQSKDFTVTAVSDYRDKLAGLPESQFVGSLLWYSVAGDTDHDGAGRRITSPVRVSQAMLEQWFTELGLDPQFLPARIKKIDAFRNASSAVKREYPLDDSGRFAELRVEEVKFDAEQVIRQVVQIVRDERKEQLALHHMATLKFIRGGRTARGKRHSGDHVKWAILTRVQGQDREQTESLVAEFEERYEDLVVNLQAPAIRAVVRDILKSLGAIPMKKSGGLYFVHKSNWASLDGLQALVRRIGQGCVLEQMPLVDTGDSRDMLNDAFQSQVEDEVRLLLKEIAKLNSAAQARGGKISGKQYADLNDLYRNVCTRTEEQVGTIGLRMERAASALELATEAVMDMATRVEGVQ